MKFPTHVFLDYFINHHYKDPVINQPGFNGKYLAGWKPLRTYLGDVTLDAQARIVWRHGEVWIMKWFDTVESLKFVDVPYPKDPQGPSNGRVWTCMTQGCIGSQNRHFWGVRILRVEDVTSYILFACIFVVETQRCALQFVTMINQHFYVE